MQPNTGPRLLRTAITALTRPQTRTLHMTGPSTSPLLPSAPRQATTTDIRPPQSTTNMSKKGSAMNGKPGIDAVYFPFSETSDAGPAFAADAEPRVPLISTSMLGEAFSEAGFGAGAAAGTNSSSTSGEVPRDMEISGEQLAERVSAMGH